MKLSDQQRDLIKPIAISAVVIAVSILIAQLTPDEQQFPKQIVDAFPFADAINNGQSWLKENYQWATRAFADVIRNVIDAVEMFLVLTSWPVIVFGIALIAFRFGGLRLALVCSLSTMVWASLDMWDAAMSTLSVMFVSVLLASVLGIILGTFAAQNDRFEAGIRPILDTMQTLPGFVYLLPAIFFFWNWFASICHRNRSLRTTPRRTVNQFGDSPGASRNNRGSTLFWFYPPATAVQSKTPSGTAIDRNGDQSNDYDGACLGCSCCLHRRRRTGL